MYRKVVDYVMSALLGYLDGVLNLGHFQMGLDQCLFNVSMGMKISIKEDRIVFNQ